jgi:hypothetical protein
MARNLYVVPFQPPNISNVISQAGAGQPITASSTLLIQGQQLRGQSTLLLIENQEFNPATISDTEITLPVPTTVHAGVKGVQILQKSMMGTPAALHRGLESNIAPFVLHPTITATHAVAAPPNGTADAFSEYRRRSARCSVVE